jgi:tetratricopeptide (TPR) repeat protein
MHGTGKYSIRDLAELLRFPVQPSTARLLELRRVIAVHMHRRKFAAVGAGMLLLSGCAGVGIVATSDPTGKLNGAEYLFAVKNRPVPAEELIQQAIVIFQERNDSQGLGNANREYGDLLRSQAVVNWESAYLRSGFRERSITYGNRLEKATEYYAKALEYYGIAEKEALAADKYDALTNVYFNMGLSNLALGVTAEACTDFNRTLEAYSENMQRNPDAHPHGSKFGTIPDTIVVAKKQAGCE